MRVPLPWREAFGVQQVRAEAMASPILREDDGLGPFDLTGQDAAIDM